MRALRNVLAPRGKRRGLLQTSKFMRLHAEQQRKIAEVAVHAEDDGARRADAETAPGDDAAKTFFFRLCAAKIANLFPGLANLRIPKGLGASHDNALGGRGRPDPAIFPCGLVANFLR